jgi:hypothetical protein
LISPAAGVAVWLGASLVVVSDGRRALASGLVLVGVGLAAFAFLTVGPVAAGLLAVAGVTAAARRYFSGAPGWAILPPGSTPRLVLCIATALVVFWVAAGITGGPLTSFRFAVTVATVLSAARALSTTQDAMLLTAVGVLALSVASVGAIGSSAPSVWPYLAGGLVAACVGWLPLRTASAA